MHYLVIEIQTNEGVMSVLNYQYNDLPTAEQQYYLILSSAAVSTLDVHAAMIVDENGFVIKNNSYRHTKAPDIEPEIESEPEET